MYQRILVPVDGSHTAALGLEEALKLSKLARARVHVVNVVDMDMTPAANPFPYGESAEFISFLKAEGQRALKDAASAAAAQHVKVECTQRSSRKGRVSDIILDEAKKWRADLIVMGTHGRRGLNRLLLGSDAERVLEKAPVPVLLVRGDRVDASRPRRRRAGSASSEGTRARS